jgi:hypothetical protein
MVNSRASHGFACIQLPFLRDTRQMADVIEEVARVGLAAWVGQSEHDGDASPVLGMIGDELYLVEIDESSRERVLLQVMDMYELDDRSLRIEIALFGDAGGFFSSPLSFLGLWPKSPADIPAEVYIDSYYKAAFTDAAGDIVMSVRHAMRPGDGPPKRRFRFRANRYGELMSDLARQSRTVRDDLIALAQQRAPDRVASLQEAFDAGPPDLRLELARRAIDVWRGPRGPRG